jgi:hypothetical protein
VWHDLPQLMGGSDQGMLNPNLTAALWNLRRNEDGRWAVEWLQAYGVGSVIVNDQRSAAAYRGDVDHPEKFDGLLPVLFDNQRGDRIYRVPRRFPEQARVVEASAIEAIGPFQEDWPRDRLQAYVRAIEERPGAPVDLSRPEPERLLIRADLMPGQVLVVQETYDPYWRAYLDGRALETRQDPAGQILVLAPPGEREIELRFELPWENVIGRMVSLLASFVVLGLLLSPTRGGVTERTTGRPRKFVLY